MEKARITEFSDHGNGVGSEVSNLEMYTFFLYTEFKVYPKWRESPAGNGVEDGEKHTGKEWAAAGSRYGH